MPRTNNSRNSQEPTQNLKLTRPMTHDEAATTLAALRVFQTILTAQGEIRYSRQELCKMEHFEDDDAVMLSPEQIDELCEAINFGDFDASAVTPSQEENDEIDARYREAAKEEHVSEGTLEIDAGAIVSRSDDGGAYIAAWVWVDCASVDVCKCGADLSNGEGYNGKCGDCADKA